MLFRFIYQSPADDRTYTSAWHDDASVECSAQALNFYGTSFSDDVEDATGEAADLDEVEVQVTTTDDEETDAPWGETAYESLQAFDQEHAGA